MKLPKSVTRVTPFSWCLAILILFAFLMTAFYAGTLFQQKYAQLKISPSTIQPNISPGKSAPSGRK